MLGTVLVIGAAGGVGRAVTATLLDAGYSVVATISHNADIARFREDFESCQAVHSLDLADPAIVREVIERIVAQISQPLAGAIVCAAVAIQAPVELTPVATLQHLLTVNSVAPLAIYQATIPALRKSKGRLVFISSFSGEVGFPMQGAYTASKFALEGLADVMRQEATAWGVEVVLLQPGGIDTPMVAKAIRACRDGRAGLTEEMRALYGWLYDRYEALACERDVALTDPRDIASMVMTALTDVAPMPRYVIGSDAVDLLAAKASLSDREMDQIVLQLFGFGETASSG